MPVYSGQSLAAPVVLLSVMSLAHPLLHTLGLRIVGPSETGLLLLLGVQGFPA